jgi:hypothetical protein
VLLANEVGNFVFLLLVGSGDIVVRVLWCRCGEKSLFFPLREMAISLTCSEFAGIFRGKNRGFSPHIRVIVPTSIAGRNFFHKKAKSFGNFAF